MLPPKEKALNKNVQGKPKKHKGSLCKKESSRMQMHPRAASTLSLIHISEKGVLAGYPVVGLKATLLDGSYHPVDSSEMAFIMAAKLAYKAAMPEAGPVILEPIHTLKAHVPNDNTGDIMGDVTKRRGRVLGMEPDDDGLQTIIAEVPLAELANFTTFIRQTTQGRGWFTTEFARYEVLPEMLVPAVVEQAKKLGNLDESADD